MTIIAYNIGKRILWGFNIEVTPWSHDGKCDLIVGSIALPPKNVRAIKGEAEKKLLLLSKKIQKLQEESQRIVDEAYPSATEWKNPQP